MSVRLRFSFVLALAALSGCSASDRKQVYPVTGSVFVKGQPAAGARIFFHPSANPTNPKALRPFAVVAADGTFRITTYVSNDGAPPGDYVVTITWPARPAAAADEGVAAVDRLNGAFGTPVVSKLRAAVSAGPNTLEAFRLP